MGGNEPFWARNGELFYRMGNQGEKMMVVEFQTRPSFAAGRPRLLFEDDFASNLL